MSHKLFRRNGKLYHDIRFRDADGRPDRKKSRCSTDNVAAAKEEGALLEVDLIKEAHLGKRKGANHILGDANQSYLTFQDRHVQTVARLARIEQALDDLGKGKVKLAEFNQELIDELARKMFAKDTKASTKRANLYAPLTAVLNHAHKRGWCARPEFDLPKIDPTETNPFTPEEAFAFVQAARLHHRPLFVFLFCTGCRKGEALQLDWKQVDFDEGIVTIIESKTGGKRRKVEMVPALVAALRQLGPKDSGPVFTTYRGEAYTMPATGGGAGQLGSAFDATAERAGLADRGFHPHCTRHSWASWHYCVNKDILLLKREGGWATLSMVERYAHLMPQKHRAAVLRFWGIDTPLQAVA